MATDLASLQIEVVTSMGDSEAKLAALGTTADTTAGQLAGVEVAAAKVGPGLGGIQTATAAAEGAFGRLGMATAAAMAPLATIDTSAATTAASIESMTAPLGVATVGMKALTPALGEAATATERVSREAVILPLHLAHLGESAASGSVSMRMLASVLGPMREGLGAIASTIGISVTALVGLGIGLALLAVEMVKSAKDAQELDQAITGMSQGVAEGTGLTTKAFKKETDAAAEAAGISKSSAEEIGQAFIKTGNASTDGLRDTIESATKYARLMGITVPEAMKVYANAFEDPIKGMADLGKGIVDFTTKQQVQIATLVGQGKADEAAAIEMAVLKAKTDELAKSGVTLSSAWAATKNGFGAAIEGMVNLVAWIGRTYVQIETFQLKILGLSWVIKALPPIIEQVGKGLAVWGQGFVREGVLIETFFKELNYGTPIIGALATAFATATGKITALEDEEKKAAGSTQKINNEVKALIQTEQDKINALVRDKKEQEALRAQIAAGTGDQTAAKAALDALTASIKSQEQAMKDAKAAAIDLNDAWHTMLATQDAEAKASDAAGVALQKEAAAARDSASAQKADAAAIADAAKSTSEAAAANDAMLGTVQKATDALTAESKALNDNATAANSDATAANSAASAQSGLASAAASSSGNVTNAGSGQIPSMAVTFHIDDPTLGKIKSLQDSISKLGGISAPGAAPTAPTPPKESAGATVASQPGAFGGDKNASFFSDPATRQTFLAQFGIQGDAATKAADRAYQTQVQQYQLQLQQYNSDVAAYATAQNQLKVEQQQLDALLALQRPFLSGGGTYGKALGAASGGDWRVNGAPGQDQNFVGMNLSHGELISVTPPGQSLPQGGAGGNPVTVNLTISTPDVASFKQSRSQVVNQVSAMLAAATKNRTTNARQ